MCKHLWYSMLGKKFQSKLITQKGTIHNQERDKKAVYGEEKRKQKAKNVEKKAGKHRANIALRVVTNLQPT